MRGQSFLLGGAILIVGIIIVYSLSSGINVDILNAEIIISFETISDFNFTGSGDNVDELPKFYYENENEIWFLNSASRIELWLYNGTTFSINKSLDYNPIVDSRDLVSLTKKDNFIYITYIINGARAERFTVYNITENAFIVNKSLGGASNCDDNSYSGQGNGISQPFNNNDINITILESAGLSTNGAFRTTKIRNRITQDCNATNKIVGGANSRNSYSMYKAPNNTYYVISRTWDALHDGQIKEWSSIDQGLTFNFNQNITKNITSEVRETAGAFYIDSDNVHHYLLKNGSTSQYFKSNSSGIWLMKAEWNNSGTNSNTFADLPNRTLMILMINGTNLLAINSENRGETWGNFGIFLTSISAMNTDYNNRLMIAYTNNSIRFGKIGESEFK